MRQLHPEQERAVARILENLGIVVAGAFLVGLFFERGATLVDLLAMAAGSLTCWWRALVIYGKLGEQEN